MTQVFVRPGPRDLRGPVRYLWWLVRNQPVRVGRGALFGTLWTVALTLPPYMLRGAIDHGLQAHRSDVLLAWTAGLLGVGIANAGLAMARHRTMTRVRMDGAFRTIRAVVEQTVELGAALPRRVSAGEVTTIGISDVWPLAEALTVTGPGIGAVVAYLVVAGLLLSISPLLAIVVLAGVPVLAVIVGPLLGRLQRAGMDYREQQGRLTGRIVDMVGGLRILNGLGGKDQHAERYRRQSQLLRTSGYRVGAVTSWVQALGVGLPALFLAVVTWLAARMAAQGTITVGDLAAVYGYVAVLVVPVAFFIEGGFQISRALVAGRRVIAFLSLPPDDGATDRHRATGKAEPAEPSPDAELYDPASGVRLRPGQLTALVSARPAEAALIVERLGRFVDSDATWGAHRLDSIAKPHVRWRILVADNGADLFAGPLRDVVTTGSRPDEAALNRALYAAVAKDIVDALPAGLDSMVDSNGRNLSGGQRQRLRLVRALLAEPEVLLAVEPTSAVDAHTEAAMAERLYEARSGRTTLVTTTSPLVLDRADVVHHLVDGRVVASGRHRALLADESYRALVSRGAGDESGDGSRPMEVAR